MKGRAKAFNMDLMRFTVAKVAMLPIIILIINLGDILLMIAENAKNKANSFYIKNIELRPFSYALANGQMHRK
jgi:hypothetical protein